MAAQSSGHAGDRAPRSRLLGVPQSRPRGGAEGGAQRRLGDERRLPRRARRRRPAVVIRRRRERALRAQRLPAPGRSLELAPERLRCLDRARRRAEAHRGDAGGIPIARSKCLARGSDHVLDVHAQRCAAGVPQHRRARMGGDRRELLLVGREAAGRDHARLSAVTGRPAHPLARSGRNGQDVRASRARLGVARVVPVSLHRRSGLVLRPARGLPHLRRSR